MTGYPDVIPPLQVRPTLMTVCVVLASLVPILQETGAGADVMKCIVASIMGGTKLQEIQTCYYIFVTALVDSGYVSRKNFPFNSFRTTDSPFTSQAFGREPNALLKLRNLLRTKILAPRGGFEPPTFRLTAEKPTSSELAGVGPNRRKSASCD